MRVTMPSAIDLFPFEHLQTLKRAHLQARLFLDSLGKRDLELTRPLEVRIQRESDGFVVYCDELHLSGIGGSVREALADLIDFLISDFSIYTTSDINTLTAEARLLRNTYKQLIRRRRRAPASPPKN